MFSLLLSILRQILVKIQTSERERGNLRGHSKGLAFVDKMYGNCTEHCGTTGFVFTRRDALRADCKLRVVQAAYRVL